MKFRGTVKTIRKAKPVRNVLDYTDGKLDVVVTSSSLFSEINASPSLRRYHRVPL